MSFVKIADSSYVNLRHVTHLRLEEHGQFGKVLAIYFVVPNQPPVYVSASHYAELEHLLPLMPKPNGTKSPT